MHDHEARQVKATVKALGMHGIFVEIFEVQNTPSAIAQAQQIVFASIIHSGVSQKIAMGQQPDADNQTVTLTIQIIVQSRREDMSYADLMRQSLAENAPAKGMSVQDITPEGRRTFSRRHPATAAAANTGSV
jgi:hypothetical protein